MLNRKLHGPEPGQIALRAAAAMLLVAAALLLVLRLPAEAQANDRDVSGVTLTSPNPGELVITWDAPSRAPNDYRVTWKKSDGKWHSYKNANTVDGGNAFPTGTSHTVTGLEEGTAYQARVRARYHNSGGKVEKSGPWSDAVEIRVSAKPPDQGDGEEGGDSDGGGDSNQGRSTNPPAKPTGLLTAASHDSVLLSWTDPGDTTITGYQVLRGDDADSLTVLLDDTESAGTSYTDDTVEAETTYVYAVRGRNTHGLSPQSDAVSVTTPAAPPAKPTGLLTAASHDNVVLSWTDPSDGSITGYQVLRGPDADNLAVLVDNTGSSSLSYTDSMVAAETTYAYAVRARTTGGLSPQADAVSVTTPATPALPAKPQGLLAAATHSSVLLIWTDPGDDTITGYQILRGPDAANLAVLTNDTGNANTSYTDKFVTAETTYVYAVRARTTGGLSLQSATATANTPAAPVEPESAPQLAGVDFIIAGQLMDTTGTCSEADITMIADGCTHDITNPMPQFGVVGTLDGGDRVSVRIGRDLAGLANVADQSDLQGLNKRITPTFQPGRNLLRVWGDENEAPGGGEAHFFRTNVLPYWELNGERLSKDSACQSTTSRTAAQITDSDCILTTFKDAEFRFYNVINEHFNAYVDLNGDRVIREPDNTALAEPFTLDLQDGENVLVIRLAALGGQPQGEVYDSDSFYYKVTGTPFLVSNLGTTSLSNPAPLALASLVATQFTTGSNPLGYAASKVKLPISVATASVTPVVWLYTDVSGSPGSSIKALTNPSTISVSTTATTEVEFNAGDQKLTADTSYWIILEKPAGSDEIYTEATLEDTEDAVGAPGWRIGNVSKSRPTGGTFTDLVNSHVMQIAVKGALFTRSDDATLSALALTDPDDNAITLDPTFASGVEDYTAAVAAAVSRIKVDPTGNDDNAIIEYLDGGDTALTDADTNTPDVFDVVLAEGDNVVKVRVTAGDGMTTKTYTVTVTRQEAPNSPATGRPSISGMLEAGHTLTASTSNIRDDDGLSNRAFTFQWVRVDGATETNISGADAQVYTLTVDDVGFKIKLVVGFLDDLGEPETVESMSDPSSGSIQAPATGS